jgi:hypothetical protein
MVVKVLCLTRLQDSTESNMLLKHVLGSSDLAPRLSVLCCMPQVVVVLERKITRLLKTQCPTLLGEP